jgi:hypothetical protein
MFSRENKSGKTDAALESASPAQPLSLLGTLTDEVVGGGGG